MSVYHLLLPHLCPQPSPSFLNEYRPPPPPQECAAGVVCSQNPGLSFHSGPEITEPLSAIALLQTLARHCKKTLHWQRGAEQSSSFFKERYSVDYGWNDMISHARYHPARVTDSAPHEAGPMKVQKPKLHEGSHLSGQVPEFNCINKAQSLFVFPQIIKVRLMSTPVRERVKVQACQHSLRHQKKKKKIHL